MQRLFLAFTLAIAALLAVAAPAYAGGWAVVTLDSLPREVRAGQVLRLGFMVRQHGRTPIDNDPFGNGPLKPYLVATNKDTGEALRVDARKAGPLGHFVVDVTFPRAGTWEWSITPPPFEGTTFAPLTVLPAAGTGQSTASEAALSPARLLQPDVLRWAGLGLLLVAGMLALAAKRLPRIRRVAPRAR